jgi:hypothetical protein
MARHAQCHCARQRRRSFEPLAGLLGAASAVAEVLIPRSFVLSDSRRVRFVIELRTSPREQQHYPNDRPVELMLTEGTNERA